ncbi:MAG: hypothetical protein C5B52_11080 [Bacteroidetes bacterium]|nr:MAG: hypothetical protein C5B52_11080 [Bacteroidota bacterium]
MNSLKSLDSSKCASINPIDEDLKFPHQVIDDFFNAFQLQQARAELWQWLVAALENESGDYYNEKSKKNLIAFYETLESLVEAAWMIDQNRKSKKQS